MRALVVNELKGPDAISIGERPLPEPGPGELLIDVVAAGVSFPDLLVSQGLYQRRSEPPYVPGFEVAGRVRQAPAGSRFTAGDRVYAGATAGFAEVARAPERMVFRLPDVLSFEQGAALLVNYQTAVFALAMRGGFRAGESLFVLGASGGVGTAAIQVGKGLGASRVIGLVSTADKVEPARKAGADDVFLVEPGWREWVVAGTGGRGADVVYDPVGGDRFDDAVRCLAPAGRLLVIGFAGGAIPSVKVNRLLLRNVSVVGAAWGEWVAREPELPVRVGVEIERLIEAGAVRPVVGDVLPLERGGAAFRLLADRKAVGKVVLRVAGSDRRAL
jgi:NADPH2:quinone reductase